MTLSDGLNPEHGIAVFTDGSADHRDRSGGWAWLALDAFEGVLMESGFVPNTTISRMELLAPAQALGSLYEKYGSCDMLVYSDSEYVVKGINEPSRSRNVNKTWWETLVRSIAAHNYVEFHHVRGHTGNEHNELVDGLAGEARRAGQAKEKESNA